MKKNIYNFDYKELEEYAFSKGLGRYRAKQIFKWLYSKGAGSVDDFTDISKDMRNILMDDFTFTGISLKRKEVSKLDNTARYSFLTEDGYEITSVYLPEKNRNTICISSQIGCAVGCVFCNSSKRGFKRNLELSEILMQALLVERDIKKRIDAVLYMGMGEPMLNYDNVSKSLKIFLDKDGFALGRKHITVSTSGYVPYIEKLKDEKVNVRLAVSLHAPDDDTRSKLIPGNIHYKIDDILKSAVSYAVSSNVRLTLEYVLIKNVNSSLLHAKKLVKLINKIRAKDKTEVQLNLIPYNDTFCGGFEKPADKEILEFQNAVKMSKIQSNIRKPKGADLNAACGQLGVF